MGTSTAGGGNDQVSNQCGIAQSHAYTILSAFTMTDSAGTAHKMAMIRNPWGTTYYSYTWNKDDTNWTDALAAQVPFGIDPRTSAQPTSGGSGIFVVPMAAF